MSIENINEGVECQFYGWGLQTFCKDIDLGEMSRNLMLLKVVIDNSDICRDHFSVGKFRSAYMTCAKPNSGFGKTMPVNNFFNLINIKYLFIY